MAKVLVLGGGFGGVVAAESLAKRLGHEHQIMLVSRSSNFIFYPALVRLAFGKAKIDDISYDLRDAMLDRRLTFIQGEVARVDPYSRCVTIAHGDIEGQIRFDYLIFALGRRLATEQVRGFFEHAYHLLTPDAALKFGAGIVNFHEGHAVFGYCSGARLPVPVYEAAFFLSRLLKERGDRNRTRITIVSPSSPEETLGDATIAKRVNEALREHEIELLPNFPIARIDEKRVESSQGHGVPYDLLMLIPPFQGASAVAGMNITDSDGYLRVDRMMRVRDMKRIYAVGDCVNFAGPKLGHMAVRQGEVAALNVAAELEGREPDATYDHEIMLVIDTGGRDSIYGHKMLWDDSDATVRQGRFWSWAKRVHELYWQQQHS
jgi:sulfide:quinone oxidoreductase